MSYPLPQVTEFPEMPAVKNPKEDVFDIGTEGLKVPIAKLAMISDSDIHNDRTSDRIIELMRSRRTESTGPR